MIVLQHKVVNRSPENTVAKIMIITIKIMHNWHGEVYRLGRIVL